MGRKAWMAVAALLLGLGFGVYCIHHNVNLSEAGLYLAAVNTSAIGYMHYNVKQKQNGS